MPQKHRHQRADNFASDSFTRQPLYVTVQVTNSGDTLKIGISKKLKKEKYMSLTKRPKSVLIKNATILVTMDKERREIKNGGMYIEDGEIKQVGSRDTLPQRQNLYWTWQDEWFYLDSSTLITTSISI